MNAPHHPIADRHATDEWRRSVDKRRFMTSRFVRRGASYGEAIRAAHTLFPLAKMPITDALAPLSVLRGVLK